MLKKASAHPLPYDRGCVSCCTHPSALLSRALLSRARQQAVRRIFHHTARTEDPLHTPQSCWYCPWPENKRGDRREGRSNKCLTRTVRRVPEKWRSRWRKPSEFLRKTLGP